MKGFKTATGAVEGLIRFDEQFQLVLVEKKAINKTPDILTCPKCSKGTILKGKTAYGCSAYKDGCDFRVSYEAIRTKAVDKQLTKELVFSILKDHI